MPRMPNTEREALAAAVKHGSLVMQRGVWTYPDAKQRTNEQGERTPTFEFQTSQEVVQSLLSKGYLNRAGANTVRPSDKGRQYDEAGGDSAKTAAAESKSFQEEHDQALAGDKQHPNVAGDGNDETDRTRVGAKEAEGKAKK